MHALAGGLLMVAALGLSESGAPSVERGAPSPSPSPPSAADAPRSTLHPPLLQPVAWWAVPSNNAAYLGYYVGGGATPILRAEPRHSLEGTWGWDYQGWLLPRRVNIGWWHGRRYQGGTGAYRTDGPRYHETD